MSETTQKDRDNMRAHAERTGCPTLRKYVNDADRLARIESACLLRSEIDAPEGAAEWGRDHDGFCWLSIWNEQIGGYESEPAPDYHPNESGPITLPIVDA